MATDKRERQRQNRAVKQKAESKVARKQKTIDLTKRVAIWVVVGIVFIFAANVVWG
jgi:uncharacterized membrane protein